MIPKPLKEFVSNLKDATDKKKLEWSEGDGKSYICDHKNHSLSIDHEFDPEILQSTFKFYLETDGKVTPFTVKDSESDYDTMRSLYETVIANANDVENDIEDFFD